MGPYAPRPQLFSAVGAVSFPPLHGGMDCLVRSAVGAVLFPQCFGGLPAVAGNLCFFEVDAMAARQNLLFLNAYVIF
ncbi:MAG: hypothetical protein A2Y02_02940 [Omnitrophica bacterium GWA2_52_12]|nr:MAG: hypothetical protein A2Y02_02940 [Omnitrophica bacterium GWA2_52_12]